MISSQTKTTQGWNLDVNISGVLDELARNRRKDVLDALVERCLNGNAMPRAVSEYFEQRDMMRHGVFHPEVHQWVFRHSGKNLGESTERDRLQDLTRSRVPDSLDRKTLISEDPLNTLLPNNSLTQLAAEVEDIDWSAENFFNEKIKREGDEQSWNYNNKPIDSKEDLDQVEFGIAKAHESHAVQIPSKTIETGICDRMLIDEPIQILNGLTRTRTSSGYLEFRNAQGELTARYKL